LCATAAEDEVSEGRTIGSSGTFTGSDDAKRVNVGTGPVDVRFLLRFEPLRTLLLTFTRSFVSDAADG
jgi:hypothetical protein